MFNVLLEMRKILALTSMNFWSVLKLECCDSLNEYEKKIWVCEFVKFCGESLRILLWFLFSGMLKILPKVNWMGWMFYISNGNDVNVQHWMCICKLMGIFFFAWKLLNGGKTMTCHEFLENVEIGTVRIGWKMWKVWQVSNLVSHTK